MEHPHTEPLHREPAKKPDPQPVVAAAKAGDLLGRGVAAAEIGLHKENIPQAGGAAEHHSKKVSPGPPGPYGQQQENRVEARQQQKHPLALLFLRQPGLGVADGGKVPVALVIVVEEIIGAYPE